MNRHKIKFKTTRLRAVWFKEGFTLVEIMVAMTIFTIVIGALFSTVFAALKMYYINNDYLDIGGQTRRLVDDMIANGTFANLNEANSTDFRDVAIFNDISDVTAVTRGNRGDVLMFFKRSPIGGTGNIDSFVCYYLAKSPPASPGAGPISVWRRVGTLGATPTPSPATALATYSHPPDKQVSSTVLTGTLPRSAVTARAGIFTNDGTRLPNCSATVLVNLPASLVARSPGLSATSNVTIAISPRH